MIVSHVASLRADQTHSRSVETATVPLPPLAPIVGTLGASEIAHRTVLGCRTCCVDEELQALAAVTRATTAMLHAHVRWSSSGVSRRVTPDMQDRRHTAAREPQPAQAKSPRPPVAGILPVRTRCAFLAANGGHIS